MGNEMTDKCMSVGSFVQSLVTNWTSDTRKTCCDVPISGVISPLFAYSWIDNCYYFISLVHGLLSFESLSHCTCLAIFNAIVCGDLISYTCIISDVVLDLDKKVTVTGIGAGQ